jgi:hypothetical protein
MQRLLLLASMSASVFLPAAPARGAAELKLAPKEGLVLEKHGRFKGEMKLEEFTLEVDDQKVPIEAPEITNTFTGTSTIKDTYAKVGDGRVERLERSFDELTQSQLTAGGPEGDVEEESESPLQGATVVFAWDDGEGEYTASYGEDSKEDLDEELLADLDQSLDFEQLLPGKAVAEDDTWTLDAEGVRAVLSLGGDFHFDDEEETPQDKLIGEALEDELEATATCTYRGTREVDGRELAVIEITLAGPGHAEADADEGTDEIKVEVHREVDAKMELEGELLWDTEAGHFVSIALKGSLEFSLDEAGTAHAGEETQEQHAVLSFAGTMSIEFEASAP